VILDGVSSDFPRLLDLKRRELGRWARLKLKSVHGDARVAVLRCLLHSAQREQTLALGG